VKLRLGQVVITRPALAYAEQHKVNVLALVARHAAGDWGDLGAHDKHLNDAAVEQGDRVLSAYDVAGERWYVITEHDRSYTTVMLASDY
jgi:uncharacterized protein HemY